MTRTTRREFVERLLIGPAALALAARAGWSADEKPAPRRLRFGLISDVHQDVMPDGVDRIRAFVEAMEKAKVDFILHLGDFCQPHPRNRPFLEAWNAFSGPRYHVLGNHDMDGGFKRDQTAAFYGIKGPYYTFPAGPALGIVLDGNESGGKTKGYARFVGPTQLAWLERELAQADRPVFLFIHQPLDHPDGIVNGAAVRAVIEQAEAARPGRVLAVFCGHFHQDYERLVNGVRHVQINGASYVWLPDKAARETYPSEVHRQHPHLRNVAAYREPLWAVVSLDLDRGGLAVEGKRSEWVGPDPWQRGAGEKEYPRELCRPSVSDRKFTLASLNKSDRTR